MHRDNTRMTHVGNLSLGGGAPIRIQSMTNTDTRDVDATVSQIKSLERAGCEIIRCAVPDMTAAKALKEIKERIGIPLVADIHFDHKLAIAAMESGADKVRINPGNIGSEDKIRAVVDCAKERNLPLRVGVNSGSLERNLVEKYGGVTAEALAESALKEVALVEKMGYDNMVISIKSSNVLMSLEAHRLVAAKCNYPLHVGITEAGGLIRGNIKSALGIGLILNEGMGDTIRVSLTGDPVEEVKSARMILRTLGLRREGIELVSCPTCGRTRVDLIGLSDKVERLLEELESTYDIKVPITLAVMGCAVNGPGEAREADLGIAGGHGEGLFFRKGEIVKKVPEDKILDALRDELIKTIEQ